MNPQPLALVVDDSELTRRILRRHLVAEGYRVVEAADGVEGALAALRDLPAVVVTDLDMPVMDGFQLARLLKNDPGTRNIPLVILTSHSEARARFWGHDSGADAYVTKDELEERLLPTVRALLEAGPSHGASATGEAPTTGPMEVLARVARQLDRGLLEATLVKEILHLGIDKETLSSGVRAVLAFLARVVDVDLLAIGLADDRDARLHLSRPASATASIDVGRVCKFLATEIDVAPGSIPVIQVDGTVEGPDELIAEGHALRLDLSLRDARGCLVAWPRRPGGLTGAAADLLATTAPHVALVLDNLRLAEKLWTLSTHDELTGVLNHRAILDRLREETERARRYRSPLSVALCDIDRFKSVNDRFGHPTGDLVLREVAARLRSALRSSDVIGRYGGEEFLILFPSTELGAACQAASRLCGALASEPVAAGGPDEVPVTVTASFGVACSLESLEERSRSEALVSTADRRLYEAKAAGRCCVRP